MFVLFVRVCKLTVTCVFLVCLLSVTFDSGRLGCVRVTGSVTRYFYSPGSTYCTVLNDNDNNDGDNGNTGDNDDNDVALRGAPSVSVVVWRMER